MVKNIKFLFSNKYVIYVSFTIETRKIFRYKYNKYNKL